MAYESPRSIEGPTRKRKVRRKRPTTSTVTATLGGEGQRRTERAARRAERPSRASRPTSPEPSANAATGGEGVARVEREQRQQRQQDVRRHRRQRERLQRLAERTIPRLERERERLYHFETRPASLTRDYELERKRELAKVEGHLTAAKAEQSRLSSLIRTRRGRRAEPITGLEAASAILGVLPPVRGVTALGTIARNVLGAGGAKTAAKAARAPGTIESKLSAVGRSRVGRSKAGRTRKVPRSKRETQQALGRLKKRRKPTIHKPHGRHEAKRRAGALAAAGAAAPPAAMITSGVVETTGKALVEDPEATIKTTGRVVAGLPSAVIGDIADLVSGNPDEVLDAQVAYWKQVGRIAKGGERAQEIVKSDLGLVPVITGGLTGYGIGRALGGVPRPSVTSRHSRKVRKLADQAENAPTARERRVAKEQLESVTGEGTTFRQRHAQRKREAERHAVMGEVREGVFRAETRKAGKRTPSTLGMRETWPELVARLERQALNDQVSKADVIQVLVREGLLVDDADFALRELRKRRENLREPSRKIDPDAVSTRPVLDAIIAHPEVLMDSDVRLAVEHYEKIAEGRSVERHQGRVGREEAGDRPDPLDDPARTLHLARAEGVPTAAERINPDIRSITKARPRSGEDATPKVRGEATAKINRAAKYRDSASKLRKRADREETLTKREGLSVRERQRTKPKPEQIVVSKLAKGDQWKQANGRYTTVKAIKRTKQGYAVSAGNGTVTLPKGTVVTVRRDAPLRSTAQARVRIERRAQEMRDNADSLEARADRLEAEATTQLASINRHRNAERLEYQAAELREQGDEAGADAARAEAKALRDEGNKMQAELREEAAREIGERIEQKGYRQPAYIPEVDVSDRGGLNVRQDFPGGRGGKKERRRTGALAEQGRIDESGRTLVEATYRVRALMAHNEGMMQFLGDNLVVDDDALARAAAAQRFGGAVADDAGRGVLEDAVKTGPEWRRLAREGQLTEPGLVLIPVQEWSAAIQRGDIDGADDLLGNSLKTEVQEARWNASTEPKGTRKLYGAVPEAAIKEFRQQMEPIGRVMKGVRAISRLQTGAMLATSVPWFAFQLVATPMVMAARHPNPIAWGRAAVAGVRLWKEATPKERAAFRAHFGGTSADILALGDVHSAIKAQTIREMGDGLNLAFRSPVGRLVKGLAENVRKGGPLMRTNRRYEAGLRAFNALLEMDRLGGLNMRNEPRIEARIKEFARSAAGLTDTTYRHMEATRGLSPTNRVRFYLDNPDAMRELENAVNDSQGNWAALTNAERRAASVMVFYPFVRFSLRWLFLTYPRDNPFKAAIALNLAQANAEELQTVLAGSPSYITDYGTIITHDDEGNPKESALNLARAVPGGNVIVESLAGNQDFNLSTALRPLQPAIGIIAGALDGKDQYGNEIDDANFFKLVARGGLTLSPLTRPLRDTVTPPSEVSQLFRAIDGKTGSLKEQIIPDPIRDLNDEAESVRLATLLDRAAKRPSNAEIADATGDTLDKLVRREKAADKAQREINALMRKYGIESQQEQRQEEAEVGRKFSRFSERTSEDQESGWYAKPSKSSKDTQGWYTNPKATKGQEQGGWYR